MVVQRADDVLTYWFAEADRDELTLDALKSRLALWFGPSDETDAPEPKTRFSAKGLLAQRRRLGLSAADCGVLLGTSAQSVYNWEAGKVRPRARHLAAIAALRTLGKKDAAAHVAERQGAR